MASLKRLALCLSAAEWMALYEYTADLLSLDHCRPLTQHSSVELMRVVTPLRVKAWSRALKSHPDQALARYIVNGLQKGFRIGFDYSSPLKAAATNMRSAYLHPDVIGEDLQKERTLGHMLGPFSPTHQLPPLQINKFGVIPKGHNTGKWRLINRSLISPGTQCERWD